MAEDQIKNNLAAINWDEINAALNGKGYALAKGILLPEQCKQLIASYDNQLLFRKTISMEQYRFGKGEYKYFNYPLPPLVQIIRETVYSELVTTANRWMEILHAGKKFPALFAELQSLCKAHDQIKPTVLLLKYGEGGYNTLHQDLYGTVFFPFQLVIFLNEPDKEYTGGEFVLTQQNPRAQSTAMVLSPKKGDMLIFTTNFRPVKGAKGYYRAVLKHGVSELRGGVRHTLGIIFHDAI